MLRLGEAFVANGISPRRFPSPLLKLVKSPTIRRVNLRDSRIAPRYHTFADYVDRRVVKRSARQVILANAENTAVLHGGLFCFQLTRAAEFESGRRVEPTVTERSN